MHGFHNGIWNNPKTLNTLQTKSFTFASFDFYKQTGDIFYTCWAKIFLFTSCPFLKCCFCSPWNNVAAFHRVLSEQVWKAAFNPERSQDSKVCCGHMGKCKLRSRKKCQVQPSPAHL